LLRTDRTLAREAERVVAALSTLAEQAGVDLTLSVETRAGAVPAGPLGAVLMNGVRNAIEACTAGPSDLRRVETSIVLGAEDDRVVIVITDTGTGLTGDPARSDGRGIGLGVCRSIVAEMGGRLALRDAPNGRGAVLQVEVPRHRPEAA
jgi:signal transduction histidine kinase